MTDLSLLNHEFYGLLLQWFCKQAKITGISYIVKYVEEKKLNSEIKHMIELLEQHERFAELEYKVKRLRSEFACGKSRYSPEVIRNSIAEREKEMREIEKKYVRPNDLISERQKLLKQLLC
jgi:hypothetical protein